MIHRAFRYKLAPTPVQEEQLRQFSGVVRLIYNLALEQRRDWWQHYRRTTGERLNYIAQARELTALRKAFAWIAAVHVTPQQQALRDLETAYASFFAGRAGYPSPRKRGVHDGFRFQGREIAVKRLNRKWSAVRVPKIGWVKFRDTRPMRGRTMNATLSLDPTGWHISFANEIEHEPPVNSLPSVGIDRGVTCSLMLSSGETLNIPGKLRLLDRKKRKAQRVVARRKRGSVRRVKALRRVARISARAGRIRRDWQHRVTLDLARRFGTIVLEDLKTKNMTRSAAGTADAPGKNVRAKAGLNRAILEQGWHSFETLVAYKLQERGGYLCKVDPRHTSQTCSSCGAVDRESRKSQAAFACTNMRPPRTCRPQRCDQHPAPEHGVYARGGRALALRGSENWKGPCGLRKSSGFSRGKMLISTCWTMDPSGIRPKHC